MFINKKYAWNSNIIYTKRRVPYDETVLLRRTQPYSNNNRDNNNDDDDGNHKHNDIIYYFTRLIQVF